MKICLCFANKVCENQSLVLMIKQSHLNPSYLLQSEMCFLLKLKIAASEINPVLRVGFESKEKVPCRMWFVTVKLVDEVLAYGEKHFLQMAVSACFNLPSCANKCVFIMKNERQ